MKISRGSIETLVRLVPVLVDLGREVVDLVERLRSEGYEVPSTQDLKEINERLRNLPDLDKDE